jgi:hypothetical protein
MTRVVGHALRHEGAPFDRDGKLIHGGGFIHTSGVGRARCECGAMSEMLQSANQRKAWHRDVHKPAVASA